MGWGKGKGKTAYGQNAWWTGKGQTSPCYMQQPTQMIPPSVIQPVPQAFQYMMPNQATMGMAPPQPAQAVIGRWRGWKKMKGTNKWENGNGSGKPCALPGEGDRVCAICRTKHKDQIRTHCRNPACQAKLKAVAVDNGTKGTRETTVQEVPQPSEPASLVPPKPKQLQDIETKYALPATLNETKEEEHQVKSLEAMKTLLQQTKTAHDALTSQGLSADTEAAKGLMKTIKDLEKKINAANPDQARCIILRRVADLERTKKKFVEEQQVNLEKEEEKKKAAENEIARLREFTASQLKQLDEAIALARENEKSLQGEATTINPTPVAMEHDADQQADATAVLKLQLQALQTQLDDAQTLISEKDEQVALHFQRSEATKQKFTEWLAGRKELNQQNGSAQEEQNIQQLEAWIAQQDQPPPPRNDQRPGPYNLPNT